MLLVYQPMIFSTLYTTVTLPHNLIKEKLIDLIEKKKKKNFSKRMISLPCL